ncbi:Mpo1-like protein [Halobacteriovorax sp. JY17]|uniref:Mpo1 family 2-hydroxy fatty acid dioxygenase n=1 Tax=Halobacteriovorax sp. JY17 TaxID=2014617 RepID=UPI000C6120D8|nr:Mpo1-like protein [Halobacteriovorax sp. JY17]PIK15165.1 MAG: hypothetical protein CES88_00200 [Halobacteriovorax sp. JY17]
MKTIDEWLSEYGESHRNKTNQVIHKVCVPAIEFSLLGILWLIPTPSSFWSIPYLNWATLFCAFALLFYLSLKSARYFIGSVLMLIPMLVVINYLRVNFGGIIIYGFVGLFIISWVGQFIGHRIEGKKPSFLKDLFFLLIGPLWVLRSLYRKIGIKTT